MSPKRNDISRRGLLARGSRAVAGVIAAGTLSSCASLQNIFTRKAGSKMRFGLVTYLWAKDWDLPTLIRNCEMAKVFGVELRTQHAHGVESDLNAKQRREVKKRFDDSSVTLVGLGTNFSFHYVEQDKLQADIKGAKEYVKLSHDVGSSGVKVKPNALPKEVPVEKTVKQIGRSLNELGRFALDYGQQIRVEVHGKETQQLPIMRQIFDVADHPNVTVCWNSNQEDLKGQGLVYNFNLVKDRFGATAHVRCLDRDDYPFQQLINLFVEMDYKGWILLEARGKPEDRIKALTEQAILFKQMVARARASV